MLNADHTLKIKSALIVKILLLLVLGLLLAAAGTALAKQGSKGAGEASPMHPAITLLDSQGKNVLESGQAVSTMETCGACHDTEYIASHTDHADLELNRLPYPYDVETTTSTASVEMDCFLCHTAAPNHAARLDMLQGGDTAWANTATLLDSGIVQSDGDGFLYNPDAFTAAGQVEQETLHIQDPTSQNCGLCHGTVHTDVSQPLELPENLLENWPASSTGQVFSSQRISSSGLNITGKESLTRSFDIHAERGLTCTDCHFSLNNPVYYQENDTTRPEHLSFDPRRLELGEYLQRPTHEFARGWAASDRDLAGTMRRCEGCHNTESAHTWLPYQDRHMEEVSCETCHIPEMVAPAIQQIDWTIVLADGSPRTIARGETADGMVSGYEPVLFSRPVGIESDAGTPVAPYNLVTSWYWTSRDSSQPVPTETVRAAYLDGNQYRSEILNALDADQNGTLDSAELVLDTQEKVQAVAAQLAVLGVKNPKIAGTIQPYSLNHDVAASKWVTKDCKTCHTENSRMEQPFLVASYLPGDAMPVFSQDTEAIITGKLIKDGSGQLFYQPVTKATGLYILGNDGAKWIDLLGSWFFVVVLLGVAAHGTMRFVASLRYPSHDSHTERVYMYGFYERLWHWLQTFTIVGLLFTGLIIHKPDTFGIFSFKSVVLVHNILAGILLANAALSLFYHLASGEIRQYIPRPAGFFDQAITQAIFYVRGIFKGEPHPFEKTPDRKLNPLQQATYFTILNILLPLQVITGALMWGAQHWPDLTARLGGLPFLAPFHTLIAWLFGSFIVMHVYLTTTGHAPLVSIKAMMMGWDEVEKTVPAEEMGD